MSSLTSEIRREVNRKLRKFGISGTAIYKLFAFLERIKKCLGNIGSQNRYFIEINRWVPLIPVLILVDHAYYMIYFVIVNSNLSLCHYIGFDAVS